MKCISSFLCIYLKYWIYLLLTCTQSVEELAWNLAFEKKKISHSRVLPLRWKLLFSNGQFLYTEKQQKNKCCMSHQVYPKSTLIEKRSLFVTFIEPSSSCLMPFWKVAWLPPWCFLFAISSCMHLKTSKTVVFHFDEKTNIARLITVCAFSKHARKKKSVLLDRPFTQLLLR